MKPENIDFLNSTRHHWDTLTKAFYMRGLNQHEKDGLIRVMREEFIPGYDADLYCPPCISNMVLLVYRLYDDWKAKQPAPEIAPPAEIVQDEPLQVKANFPAQEPPKVNSKKHHRR